MDRVRCPQPTDAVVSPMHPVITEFLAYEEQHPRPSVVHRNRIQSMVPDPVEQYPDDTSADQAQDQPSADGVPERGEERAPVVVLPANALQIPALDARHQN